MANIRIVKTFERSWELPKCDTEHEVSKCLQTNGTDRLAEEEVATHLQSVKDTVSAKCRRKSEPRRKSIFAWGCAFLGTGRRDCRWRDGWFSLSISQQAPAHLSLPAYYGTVSHFYPFSLSPFNSTCFFHTRHHHSYAIWHDVIIWQKPVKWNQTPLCIALFLPFPSVSRCGSVGGSHSWQPVEGAIKWSKMPLQKWTHWSCKVPEPNWVREIQQGPEIDESTVTVLFGIKAYVLYRMSQSQYLSGMKLSTEVLFKKTEVDHVRVIMNTFPLYCRNTITLWPSFGFRVL